MVSETLAREMYKLQLGSEAAMFCGNVNNWQYRKIEHRAIYLLGEVLGYSQDHVDDDFSEAINRLIPQVIGA